jgi:hypothetical protein
MGGWLGIFAKEQSGDHLMGKDLLYQLEDKRPSTKKRNSNAQLNKTYTWRLYYGDAEDGR